MIEWATDDFPSLEEFCRKHDITFMLSFMDRITTEQFIEPSRTLKFTFSKDLDDNGHLTFFEEKHYESELVRMWIPAFENNLIDKLKAKFHICDEEVGGKVIAEFEKIFKERFYSIRPYSKIQVKEQDELQLIKVIIIFCYKGFEYETASLVSYYDLSYNNMTEIIDVLINKFLKQEKEEILSEEKNNEMDN